MKNDAPNMQQSDTTMTTLNRSYPPTITLYELHSQVFYDWLSPFRIMGCAIVTLNYFWTMTQYCARRILHNSDQSFITNNRVPTWNFIAVAGFAYTFRAGTIWFYAPWNSYIDPRISPPARHCLQIMDLIGDTGIQLFSLLRIIIGLLSPRAITTHNATANKKKIVDDMPWLQRIENPGIKTVQIIAIIIVAITIIQVHGANERSNDYYNNQHHLDQQRSRRQTIEVHAQNNP